MRHAKKNLYDEVLRLKIDQDSAALQLEEEQRKHLNELDNMKKYAEGMKIALEILKKEKATEKHNTEHVLSMKVEKMKLESSIDELNAEKEYFRTLTEELEKKNEKDTQDNQNLRRSNEELTAKIEDLAFLNETLRAERDVLTNRNDKVVANVTALKTNSDILRSENEKLRSLLGEAQDSLAKTKVDTHTHPGAGGGEQAAERDGRRRAERLEGDGAGEPDPADRDRDPERQEVEERHGGHRVHQLSCRILSEGSQTPLPWVRRYLL